MPGARCPRPARQPSANPTASKAAVQLWYPMAGPKLVAGLGKTNFGLPEDERKTTLLLLLAACPQQAERGADSEGGGAFFGGAQPSLGASSPQATVYLCQNPGTMVSATLASPLSFMPVLCYPKSKGDSLCTFQYVKGCDVSICTFITPLKDPWLIKIWKRIIYVYALCNNKGV